MESKISNHPEMKNPFNDPYATGNPYETSENMRERSVTHIVTAYAILVALSITAALVCGFSHL
jgi:hypothetical protein